MGATLTKHSHLRHSVAVLRALQAVDPTRTTMLRKRFVTQMRKRWAMVQRDIRISIIDQDCFGIQPEVLVFGEERAFRGASPTRRKQFAFVRADQKVMRFMDWLREQQDASILELTTIPGTRIGLGHLDARPWTDVYVQSAYQQGIRRGRQELRKAGYNVPAIDQQPGGMAAVFNQPFHADRVAMLYTRTFEDLKTVANVANSAVRRSMMEGLTTGLSRGIAEGLHPRTIARNLVGDVNHHLNTIGKTRATVIARSEVIRAHHLANIEEYRQMQRDMKVTVTAELRTAGDSRVCPDCSGIQSETASKPISLDEAEGLIPVHPQCRCIVLPVPAKDKDKKPAPLPKGTPTVPLPGAYQPVKTLAKAERWAIDNGLTDAVLYKNAGKGWGAGMTKGKALAKFNMLNAELDRVQRHFGIKLPKIDELCMTRKAGGMAGYSPGFDKVKGKWVRKYKLVAGDQWDDATFKRQWAWEKTNKKPYFVGTREADQVACYGRHEWGHIIDFKDKQFRAVINNASNSFSARLLKEARRLQNDEGVDIVKSVSKYALKPGAQRSELFAESFAAITSPLYGTSAVRRLPATMEAIMREVIESLKE